jgi:hypothetical protein
VTQKEGGKMDCCKTCKWLSFYDWYRCTSDKEGSHDKEFIENIEETVCPNYQKREGNFWLGKEAEF